MMVMSGWKLERERKGPSIFPPSCEQSVRFDAEEDLKVTLHCLHSFPCLILLQIQALDTQDNWVSQYMAQDDEMPVALSPEWT